MSAELKQPTETTPSSLLAPEESILTKYSQHHEFPLSTLISIVTHCLVALIGFLAGAFVWDWASDRESPPVGMLKIVDGTPGGGGKHGPDADTQLKEPRELELTKPARLADGTPMFVLGDELVEKAAKSRFKNLQEQEEGARKTAGREEISKGDGGGDEGGKGKTRGPGEGPGNLPGVASKRALRLDRWVLSVKYTDGGEYLRKLTNLQAMVAFAENDKFRLFPDLSKRPLHSTLEDSKGLGKLNRIYWATEDPEALQELAKAMGLSTKPKRAYIFFPRELEEELLKAELAQAKMSEDQVNERGVVTKFRAERQGDKWLVTVLQQKPRK